MGSGFTISTCPPSGCSRKLLSSRGRKEQERIRPFKMFPLCVIYPLRKSHFSSPRGISVIYNAKLLYRRWQFVFSIVFSRWHQGHRLSSDKDVYATPQHWDKITPLHQVRCHLWFRHPLQLSHFFCLLEGIIVFSGSILSLLTFLSSCCSSKCLCAVEIKQFGYASHSLTLLVSSVLMEGLVTPLQDKIEEWKKTANQLDKDHAKGEQQENTNFK